MEVLILLFK